MLSLEKQNRLVLYLALLNLLVLLAWTGFFVYTRNQMGQLSERYNALAVEHAKETYVGVLSRDLRETESLRTDLDSFFVSVGEEATFLEKMENLAKHAGVNMKVVTFEKKEKALHLFLETSGSFSGNYYFLALVESLPYQLRVNRALFDKTESGKQNTWKGQYEISLESYLATP